MENKKVDKLLIRQRIFKNKERFHKEQAKLPFEEKIEILVKLQEIAAYIKRDSKKKVWGQF